MALSKRVYSGLAQELLKSEVAQFCNNEYSQVQAFTAVALVVKHVVELGKWSIVETPAPRLEML